jgi:peptidoglycan/LPS O-acetylase OafA/YrhL
MSASRRSVRLDVLRAVAVLLVLVFHLELPAKRPSFVLYPILEAVHRAGWMGVDLFFVLSGFLVSGLLFREYQRDGRVRPGRFLLRRGLKIYPAFWTLMVATVIVWPQESNGRSLAIELAFLQNYWPTIWGHTWSLAVEEHFYLLVAIGCALMARRSGQPFAMVPRIVAAMCFVVLVMRTQTVLLWPSQDVRNYMFPTHLRIDALACGVGLSYAYHFHRQGLLAFAVRYRPLLVGAGLLLLVPPFVWPLRSTLWIPTIGFTSLYLGAAAILLAWLPAPEPAHPIARGLAYIGSHSYSMYLWHVPFNHVLFPQLGGNWGLYALAYLCGSVMIGIGMAALIEFPVMRLRDRYWPDIVRPAVPAAATV